MRRPLIALVLLLIAPLAFAQVYKWTDAKGTVHYSETPPPTGTKYNQVSVNGGVVPLAQGSSSAGAASSDSSSSADSKASGAVADTPDNRGKMCDSIKANLSTLQGSGPVVMQLGGEQKLLNDDQRKDQINNAQSQYQLYCASK